MLSIERSGYYAWLVPLGHIIAEKLNDRPRKTLGFKTPKEIFHE